MAAKEKKPYYIEPKIFKDSLRKYYDTDILTDDLAENIKKIAYGLSYNASFINYTYKDDMIGDALIKMYAIGKCIEYRLLLKWIIVSEDGKTIQEKKSCVELAGG